MSDLNKTSEKSNAEDNEQVKRTYHAPQLVPYGNLSELVQVHPARGKDGSHAPDCTLS